MSNMLLNEMEALLDRWVLEEKKLRDECAHREEMCTRYTPTADDVIAAEAVDASADTMESMINDLDALLIVYRPPPTEFEPLRPCSQCGGIPVWKKARSRRGHLMHKCTTRLCENDIDVRNDRVLYGERDALIFHWNSNYALAEGVVFVKTIPS